MNSMHKVKSTRFLGISLTFVVFAGYTMLFGVVHSHADSPSATPTPAQASLPDLGLAPELTNDVWVNSPALRLADLRGRAVLLNFWTFGCFNCRNVLPYIRQWDSTYSQKGLTVIGIHFPEFPYEANLDNLKQAVKELNVTWAVAEDNAGQAWRAYDNHFWPTIYLIDKWGRIRYRHIGEGAYDETENTIKALLAEDYTLSLPAWQKLPFKDVTTGQERSFAEFSGKQLVIETFATWCPTCRKQLAEVAKIHSNLEEAGVVYIALGIDPSEDTGTIRKFAEDNRYDWIFGVSSDELRKALIETFGHSVINPPATPIFLIAPDGKASTLYTGFQSAGELRKLVQD